MLAGTLHLWQFQCCSGSPELVAIQGRWKTMTINRKSLMSNENIDACGNPILLQVQWQPIRNPWKTARNRRTSIENHGCSTSAPMPAENLNLLQLQCCSGSPLNLLQYNIHGNQWQPARHHRFSMGASMLTESLNFVQMQWEINRNEWTSIEIHWPSIRASMRAVTLDFLQLQCNNGNPEPVYNTTSMGINENQKTYFISIRNIDACVNPWLFAMTMLINMDKLEPAQNRWKSLENNEPSI